MKKLFLIIVTSLLIFSFYSSASQLDFSKVKVKTTHVAGNVYMLELSIPRNFRGVLTVHPINLGVSSGPDGILLVDSGYEQLADKIQEAFAEIGGDKLKYVINSHWHLDHTSGNKVFGINVPIIAHTYTREKLMSGHKYSNGRVLPPFPQKALPRITFEDSLSLHFNGEEIKLFHVRYWQTRGDIIVYFTKSKVVYAGDYIRTHQFPHASIEEGRDVEKYAVSLDNLIRSLPPDIKIISSHEPLSTMENLRDTHRMIVETTDIVRQRILAGKSLDVIKKEDLPEKYQSWHTIYATTKDWIELIYRCLTREESNKLVSAQSYNFSDLSKKAQKESEFFPFTSLFIAFNIFY